MQLHSDFLFQTLGLPVPSLKQIFSAVITDSRKKSPQSVFFALKGEKFDGHNFIDAAIANGATAVVCHDSFLIDSREKNALFLKVSNVLEAYCSLAAAWRKQFKIPVLAIGGSSGKTTTKEILAAILFGKFQKILKTEKSENGFIGIPKTLLNLRLSHQCAVIEIGIDEIGAMKKHAELVSPTHALLTTIGFEHLEHLKNLQTVASEETYLLQSVAQQNGFIVINQDDPWIAPLQGLAQGKQYILYTMQSPSKINHTTVYGKLKHFQGLEVRFKEESFVLDLPLSGSHNAQNLLAAVSLALGLGLNSSEIKKGLFSFIPAEGRSQILDLCLEKNRKVRVISDYYNANPASMSAALKLLQETNTKGRSFAILGDMLDLGQAEEKLHRGLALEINNLKIDFIYLHGKRMLWLEDELKRISFYGKLEYFEDQNKIAQLLFKETKSNDCILIKGSRGMKMEQVLQFLNVLNST